MEIELAILGADPANYLKQIILYLNQGNCECSLEPRKAGQDEEFYEISINDFVKPEVKISCVCVNIYPDKAVDQLKKHEETIKEARQLINILSVKYFPSLRYNVDEQWDGIASWISPEKYRRIIYFLRGNATEVYWIFNDIEKIGCTNNFLEREENQCILEPDSAQDKNADFVKVEERFFKEIGEEKFWDEVTQEHVYFGFPPNHAAGSEVGKNAMVFWTLYSFQSVCEKNKISIWEWI